MIKNKNTIITTFLTIFVCTALFYGIHLYVRSNSPSKININEKYDKAVVLNIQPIEQSNNTGFQENKITLRMLTGEYKGQEFRTTQTLTGKPEIDLVLETNDRVLIYLNEVEDELVDIYVADFYRIDWLFVLLTIFIFLLLLFGGIKGFKSLVSLSLTIYAIFAIMVPSIVNNYPPLPVTIFVCGLVTVFTFIILNGFSRKSFSAILGTFTGVIVAGILSYLFGSLTHLKGMASEECRAIVLSPDLSVDLRGLLFSGILIGALGAIMDVSISIASSIEEIHNANPSLGFKALFLSGMNVGKDIMGTMSNTLILAYTGGSLPLIFMYMSYKTSLLKIFNLELIATEIFRSLVGSIGLILAIPLTAFYSCFLVRFKRK